MKKKIIYLFSILILLSVKTIAQVENIAPAIQQIFKEEKVKHELKQIGFDGLMVNSGGGVAPNTFMYNISPAHGQSPAT